MLSILPSKNSGKWQNRLQGSSSRYFIACIKHKSYNDPQKNGADGFTDFMLPGPSASEPGRVVMNGNETCHVLQ